MHHQCWEVLPFCRYQRQQCIKILCPKDPDFYTLLALITAKGQHLPALVVYKNQCLRLSCVCVFKTLRFKTLRFRALKERGQCDLGNCVPKRSVSSCDLLKLRFRATTGGRGAILGNCVAKTLRFCVCVGRPLRLTPLINSWGSFFTYSWSLFAYS